ncbi:MAG: hydrogenase expression/formation protein HypE [Planctomycetota bacterium]
MPELVRMAHGSGGRLMHRLIEEVFLPRFGAPPGQAGDDAAEIELGAGRCAFTTDSFVVRPLFFPGGDIGRLAVCGTVNDLAAKGARAEFLAVAFVLEEGLPLETLARVADSLAAAAREAGVRIVTGDTKVVERGAADGLYITTSGVGRICEGVSVSGANARPGDAVILSGTAAEHGVAVMNARHALGLGEAELQSDCAPLGEMVLAGCMAVSVPRASRPPLAGRQSAKTKAGGTPAVPGVHALRDPTRGGVATALAEIAQQSQVRIVIEERAVPLRLPVQRACELLGLDPLYVASEGRMLACLPAPQQEAFVGALRAHPLGREAAVIGRVEAGPAGVVLLTASGGQRPLRMLEGDPLPRIC